MLYGIKGVIACVYSNKYDILTKLLSVKITYHPLHKDLALWQGYLPNHQVHGIEGTLGVGGWNLHVAPDEIDNLLNKPVHAQQLAVFKSRNHSILKIQKRNKYIPCVYKRN